MSNPALSERPLSKTQLFCSNLPWSVNGKMLRQAFEVHGTVTDAFVAYNGRSSRGFGYVTFAEPSAAAAAVKAMNGTSLGSDGDDDRSREIRVEMARERPGPRPEPRERNDRRGGDREGGRGSSREGADRSDGRGRGRGSGDGEGRGDGRTRRTRSGRGGRGQGGGEEKPARTVENAFEDMTVNDSAADAGSARPADETRPQPEEASES